MTPKKPKAKLVKPAVVKPRTVVVAPVTPAPPAPPTPPPAPSGSGVTNATKAQVVTAINAILAVVVVFGLLSDTQAGTIGLAINAIAAAIIGATYTNSKKRVDGA